MISPSEGYILVEPSEIKPNREQETSSGIIIAKPHDDRLDLAVTQGKVIKSGSKKFIEDQQVYYNFFSGNQIIKPGTDPLGKDDKTYHIVWEEDVLGVEE